MPPVPMPDGQIFNSEDFITCKVEEFFGGKWYVYVELKNAQRMTLNASSREDALQKAEQIASTIRRTQPPRSGLAPKREQRLKPAHIQRSSDVDTKKRVFISHSSKDRDTAGKLVEFLEAGLILKPHEIRCTSVIGYMLPIGSHTSEILRDELIAAELVIGIITRDSVASNYVLFELGASWALNKPTLPLLAHGAGSDILPGPLKERHACQLSDLNQVYQMLDDIAGSTAIKRQMRRSGTLSAKAQLLSGAVGPSISAPGKGIASPFVPLERYHAFKRIDELLEHIRYDYERIRNDRAPERIRIKNGETLEATEVKKLLDTNRGILGTRLSELMRNKYDQAILLWKKDLDWENEMRTWANLNQQIQALIQDEILFSGT